MIHSRPIGAIIYRYCVLLRGSPNRVMGLYIWSLLDMVLWGFFSTYMTRVLPPGFNAISALLGAVLLMNFFSRVMLNITMTFFEDMWSRNFLSLFASPIRIAEYLIGLVVCGTLTSLFGLMLAFSGAAVIFGFSPLAYGFTLPAFLMVLYLFGIALGMFGMSIVLARGPSSEWFIWPIPAILAPFVGVFYPVDTLPHWMQQISAILPPSYVFEGVRATLSGGGETMHGLGLGFLLAIAYIALAAGYFMRVYRRVMSNGTIARYTAENDH